MRTPTLKFDLRVCVRSDLILEYAYAQIWSEYAYANAQIWSEYAYANAQIWSQSMRTLRFDLRVCVRQRSDLILEYAYANAQIWS